MGRGVIPHRQYSLRRERYFSRFGAIPKPTVKVRMRIEKRRNIPRFSFARDAPIFKGRFSMQDLEITEEKIETNGAGTRSLEERAMDKPVASQAKKDEKAERKNPFSAKRLAFMAVFTALAYGVSFLEIPLPLFGAEFLKLDFGNVFILLVSFLLGPMEAVVVCLLKEGLRCFTSTSLCAGELANFLITSVYLLVPSIAYKSRKSLKTVLISLSISSVLATGAALLANRFIIFPTFAALLGGSIYGMSVSQAFSAFWVAVLLFNLIKTVAVGAVTVLTYKRLSNFIKKWKI